MQEIVKSDVQLLLEKKIENPTDLLTKINKEFSFITKDYVLNADLEQLNQLSNIKEIINNKQNGLLAKINMFIDVIETEIEPVLSPLRLAKKRLNDIIVNIKELDVLEKQAIINRNIQECYKIILNDMPACDIDKHKLRTLDIFIDLTKKAKTVNINEISQNFLTKYSNDIKILNEQAPAYIDDYKSDYNLQRVILKKVEVETIKEREKEIIEVKPANIINQPTIIEEKPILKKPLNKAVITIEYVDDEKDLLNSFVELLLENNIRFNINKL